ncbi:MAG: sigma-70 family RNA polymerase sigma factor [Steroidobacteraceae bacterium]
MNVPFSGKRGDAAFARLCESLRPDLFRYAWWLARDRQVAEDVVQQALLRAWRSRESLADGAAARPWLLTIVRREHARLHERRRLETVSVDELVDSESPELAVTQDEDVRVVRRAILGLAPEYREPLVMQVLLGHTTGEIAAAMGIGQRAVLTRLYRARLQLRARLGLAGDDTADDADDDGREEQ